MRCQGRVAYLCGAKMWLEVNNIIKTLAKVARGDETAGETSEKKCCRGDEEKEGE